MLMLEVVSAHRNTMGRNARRIIKDAEAAEFVIGRQDNCNWVFPQDYVSRQQAVIRIVNGLYFLERKGNAPLAINDRTRPVERNRIVRLAAGDRIIIDDIEILVTELMPGEDLALPDIPIEQPPASSEAFGVLLDDPNPDILDLIPSPDPPSTTNPRPDPVMFPDRREPLEEVVSFQDLAPTAGFESPDLEDRWWVDTPTAKPRVPDPGRGSRPPLEATALTPDPLMPDPLMPATKGTALRTAIDGGVSLDDVIRGMGLDPAQVSMAPQVAQHLGEILRLVVAGTMQVLKARNDIRRELRLPSTVLAAEKNNPLKFSADVDDALHKLLIQRAKAYMGSVDSFHEAFADIRGHQIALLKSVGVAFDHMLAKFDPKRLESVLGLQPSRAKGLGFGAKDKEWQAYTQYYAELVDDRSGSYRKLFGEAWAKAYEQEIDAQKRAIPDKQDCR